MVGVLLHVLLISGRDDFRFLFDACAYDLEDVIIDTMDVDVVTSGTDPSTLAERYDLVIVVAVSFYRLHNIASGLLKQHRHRAAGPVLAYVFGGYGKVAALARHPVRRLLRNWLRSFSAFDRIYLGIGDDVAEIAGHLGVKTAYLPMASNVFGAAAKPFETRLDRPISVSAIGRQKEKIVSSFCDHLNRPDSDEIVYYTNLLSVGEATDLDRYRAMFWQILRKSRISVSFDHFFTSPEKAQMSYVGPRWFESLAAGTVVVGKAPPSEDRTRLLDWQDAAIDLSADPAEASDELLALLANEDRLRAASRETLVQMSLRHDWGHRLAELLEAEGLARPEKLTTRLEKLRGNAEALRTGISSGEKVTQL